MSELRDEFNSYVVSEAAKGAAPVIYKVWLEQKYEQQAERIKELAAKAEMDEAIIAGDGVLITGLKLELAAANALVEQAREALHAVLVMSEQGDCPQKLDAALTWRQNDEFARCKGIEALAAIERHQKGDK